MRGKSEEIGINSGCDRSCEAAEEGRLLSRL